MMRGRGSGRQMVGVILETGSQDLVSQESHPRNIEKSRIVLFTGFAYFSA